MQEEDKNIIDSSEEESKKEELSQEEDHARVTPPSIDKEWADKLGMSYDPECAETPKPEEMPGVPKPEEYARPSSQAPSPIYVMPPDTQLPPLTPQPPMPPTFMVWAILSTICCCLPAGVVAVILSFQVSSRYYAHDYEGARRASEQTELWIIISIVIGIVINALYVPLTMLMPS